MALERFQTMTSEKSNKTAIVNILLENLKPEVKKQLKDIEQKEKAK